MAVTEMKLRFTVSVTLLAILLILLTANIAQAQWNAINSGYAVTTDYHDIETPLGETVTATAGTTDISVSKITFSWLDPYDNEEQNHEVTALVSYITPAHPSNVPQEVIDWANNNPGIEFFCAQDTHDPNEVGDWTVKVTFYDATGPKCQDQTKFRATSFFVINEVPLGTIVILLIPLGFLSILALKKKAKTVQPQ